MVHSTTPGAFRPAPPRDIYNANIQIIRSQRSTAYVWVFRTGREKRPGQYMFFVPAPRPPASDSETSG